MKLVKAVSLASVSAFVVAMSYGCSSTITATDSDGGPGADTGAKKDSAQNVPDTGGNDTSTSACGPADTTAYMPRAYSPPSGKHQGICTTPNIADYVLCIENTDKTKCAQFGQGGAAETCGNCIETNQTDPKWGPFVSPDGQSLSYNTAGCLDLAVSNTQCGKSLDASYGCQDAACGTCDNTTTPTYDSCVTSSLSKSCKTYGATADKDCAAQFGDAAPAETSNCFPDPSIADPAAQDADFVKRIVTYFCGP